MEDFTIEIRDGRGVPCVQARVAAASLAEALVLAAKADDHVEWTFLEEMTGDDLARLLREH